MWWTPKRTCQGLCRDAGYVLWDLQTRNHPKNHIFRVEAMGASLLMQCSTHSDAPSVEQAMLKRGQERGDKTRVATMNTFELQTLKALGLRPIEQVELYKKFRPFVPREYWEDTCPRLSDEVLAQVKDELSKKRKIKVTKKRGRNRFGGGG
jgi:hypothetical protein